MARSLRVERPHGRYHVTARGNERKAIYRDERDRTHFLELLAESTERYGVKVHAYVLMDNHFHLLLETPEANLSRAMQWLNVSYTVWFNRRHQRAGHLLQGRFKAILVEDDAGWQELARYVHLNPVRVAVFGLDKRSRSASRRGVVVAPTPEMIATRLAILRDWRWSSYRAYAGHCSKPPWLTAEPLSRLCGGRSESERRAALRQYTESALRQGTMEPPWSRVLGGMVLGSEAFLKLVRHELKGNRREQPALKRFETRATWDQIIVALENVKGERWKEFHLRHGDWGRDAALWMGRRMGRLSLRQLGELVGGMDYAAVGQAVARFGKRLERDVRLRLVAQRLETNVKC